jgi:hypothetical protein
MGRSEPFCIVEAAMTGLLVRSIRALFAPEHRHNHDVASVKPTGRWS